MPRNVGTLTKRRVAARSKWRCRKCAVLVDEFYEIDHIKPLAQGGCNGMQNLQLLCHKCHATKTRDEAIANEPWLSITCCGRCGKSVSTYWTHHCDEARLSIQRCGKCMRNVFKYRQHYCDREIVGVRAFAANGIQRKARGSRRLLLPTDYQAR